MKVSVSFLLRHILNYFRMAVVTYVHVHWRVELERTFKIGKFSDLIKQAYFCFIDTEE